MVIHARGRRAQNSKKFHSVITEQLVLWNKTHNVKEKLVDWSQCNELTLILDKFSFFSGRRACNGQLSQSFSSCHQRQTDFSHGSDLDSGTHHQLATICFSAISFNHFKQLARYYVKLSQAKNVQDYSFSVKFNGFLIGPGRKRHPNQFLIEGVIKMFSSCCYSLIGFFITLCFTTTKKVRGLFRDKLPKRRIRTERQTTMTRFSGGTNTEMASDSPSWKKAK